MDNWKKSDGSLFFSGIANIDTSDNIVVVGDDILFAIRDLKIQMPFATIIGYVFNSEICINLKRMTEDCENVIITDNIDDVVYMMYEYASYADVINTLVFPGTLSYIRMGSTQKQFDELVEALVEMNFTHVVLYDSFCYKSLSQITPLDLYFSVIHNDSINKKMIEIYELFFGSIMYYVNFIRFLIKYKQWEDYGGSYDWIDVLEDCEELSLNWNDFIRKILDHGYRVSYIKMFADKDIREYVEQKFNHTIKVATQTRAVFTQKDSYYGGKNN